MSAPATVAEAFLQLLRARGVDCLFGNPGTEFTAIIEGHARLGDLAPRPIVVAHEFTAVAMAHGYHAMTGRAQAVMVHVTVGAANALGALMDAMHLHAPVLFCAGRTPVTERGHAGSRERFIHWAQEWYDQGGMLRETVKWDHELRDASTLEAVVDRALAIATTAPAGPVYLMLPRERLMDPGPPIDATAPTRLPAATPPAPDPAAVDEIAQRLAAAERPLIICNRLDAAGAERLRDVAETFALPVATPYAHTFIIDARSLLQASDDAISESDCVLVLDVDVPWCPLERGPSDRAWVAQAAPDPLHTRIPMRSHRADCVVTADPRLLLDALAPRLADLCAPAGVSTRRARLESAARERDAALQARIAQARSQHPIDPLWVSAALAAAWDDRMVVINELSLPPEPLPLSRPRSYFRASPASCLGWAPGMALGVGLAAPDRIPVAVVGDGAWLFGNPAVAHHTARTLGVPLLVIVLNNSGYGSITAAARGHYPDGAAARAGAFAFTDLSPSLDFAKVAEAAGGHGETVTEPEALPAAIARALRVVTVERRQALLDVRCG